MSQKQKGVFDNPANVQRLLRFFYSLCVVLFLLDFVVHRHHLLDFEAIPGFYAAFGFVACVLLVLLAKLMRKFLQRDEDYYDKR
ncbi:hypothetical protein P2G88_16465 [Aliiglaciecola sp. CAU 1673]|uniref:hypothetical protein n=1 Tax=Aliiglaciecola sp. CAU 1673 TaxID=3032595 RepID=UPI0023DCD3C0|nr:hypothetical protein [Aliiglaciecola sp. CAU 1673]MDF2179847.1 hypothetical protein [Aliiglaciecola sp. CAU 1673]